MLSLVSFACRSKQPATEAARQDTPPAATEPAAATAGPMVFDIRVADPIFKDRLLRGFYDGNEAWKWTGRQFAVSLDAPPPLDASTFVVLDFSAPDELMTVVQRSDGYRARERPACWKPKVQCGRPLFSRVQGSARIAQAIPGRGGIRAGSRGQRSATGRELGLIVVGVALHHPEDTVVNRDAATQLARQGYLELLKKRQLQLPTEKQNELMKLFHQVTCLEPHVVPERAHRKESSGSLDDAADYLRDSPRRSSSRPAPFEADRRCIGPTR